MQFKDRKFLVIGGAGLIGSHVVEQLVATDAGEIVVFDNFTRGSQENLASALEDSRVRVFPLGGNILDRDILDEAMKDVDGVFHLAALWLLHCHEFPESAFETNIRGTFNVLEACRNVVLKASSRADVCALCCAPLRSIVSTSAPGARKQLLADWMLQLGFELRGATKNEDEDGVDASAGDEAIAPSTPAATL